MVLQPDSGQDGNAQSNRLVDLLRQDKSLQRALLEAAAMSDRTPKLRIRRVITGAKDAQEAEKELQRIVSERRKKPVKEQREWGGRLEMKEQVMPLHTKPTGPIPVSADGSWTLSRKACLLEFIANGGLISDWCKKAKVGPGSVARLARKDPDFAKALDEAKSLRNDVLAEEALEIATTPKVVEEVIETTAADGSVVRAVKRYDNVYARKLAFNARLELLKKWAPEKYGDTLKVAMNDNRAQAILSARKRLQGSET